MSSAISPRATGSRPEHEGILMTSQVDRRRATGRSRVNRCALAASAAVAMATALSAAAQAEVSGFAAFGADGVTIGQSASVYGGLTGTNGNVTFVSGDHFDGIV